MNEGKDVYYNNVLNTMGKGGGDRGQREKDDKFVPFEKGLGCGVDTDHGNVTLLSNWGSGANPSVCRRQPMLLSFFAPNFVRKATPSSHPSYDPHYKTPMVVAHDPEWGLYKGVGTQELNYFSYTSLCQAL